MTLLRSTTDGLQRLGQALAQGSPVLVPMPSPITYAMCATGPAALNRAKGRPADQPVGLAVPDVRRVAEHLLLTDAALALAQWLMQAELVSVLVPVRPAVPTWMDPCVVDGHASLIGAWLDPVAGLLQRAGTAYVSSANPSGTAPAATAAEAERTFAGDLLVLDGDGLRAPTDTHGSSTVVRVSYSGQLELVRPGMSEVVHPPPEGRDYPVDALARYSHRQ